VPAMLQRHDVARARIAVMRELAILRLCVVEIVSARLETQAVFMYYGSVFGQPR